MTLLYFMHFYRYVADTTVLYELFTLVFAYFCRLYIFFFFTHLQLINVKTDRHAEKKTMYYYNVDRHNEREL